jgi:hypothetical protein
MSTCLRPGSHRQQGLHRSARSRRMVRLRRAAMRQPGGDALEDFGEHGGRGRAMLVRTEEQVAARIAQAVADPALQEVPGPVVREVARLAPGAQVSLPAPRRIVVHMRGRQEDASRPLPGQILEVGPASRPAPPITPGRASRIEPTAIRQAAELHPVRSTAQLKLSACALEPYAPAQLGPVRGIERPQFGADRHAGCGQMRAVAV